MSKKLREDMQSIKDKLMVSQKSAAKQFLAVLEKGAIQDAVAEVEALRDQMLPGSVEEQQLDAYVNVHKQILAHLAANYAETTTVVETA